MLNYVTQFQLACGDTTGELNIRQLARYTGMQCEELAEKLTALGLPIPARLLSVYGVAFKAGVLDDYFTDSARVALLDADIDLAWVSLGSANSIGADVAGAIDKVAHSNLLKIGPDGKVQRDPNGKIAKPPGWAPPDLRPALYPAL